MGQCPMGRPGRSLRLRPRRVAALLLAAAVVPAIAAELPVDLELVLAVDVSGSIDTEEAALQRRGYLAALVHPDVVRAIRGGPFGRIAVTYMEWAGEHHQRVLVDWRLVDGSDTAGAFVDATATHPPPPARWTSLSATLHHPPK